MAESINFAEYLPTSDIDTFNKMLSQEGLSFPSVKQKNNNIQQVRKHLVLSSVSDSAGCGHIRNVFPMSYLNSLFGKTGNFSLVLSPNIITQPDMLMAARSIFLQRKMSPHEVSIVQQLKQMQPKYRYRLVYDIDDFIWGGDEREEGIPDYNFGKNTISKSVEHACVEIMKMCDTVCVSTEYLGNYISSMFGIDKTKIVVVPNTIPQFFWGSKKKKPIATRLTKPRVIWTASPTHWNDDLKLAGDMNNAWRDWVIKNVTEGKIDYIQMGGCPWFFESIRNKITVVDWVNSFQYHLMVQKLRPDFGIGPLVQNKFNRAKSDIKAIEQYAVGSAFIGTTFESSPYNDCVLKLPDTATVDDIDKLFWSACEPANYNNIITTQYNIMNRDGRYTESDRNVNLLNTIL